MNHGWEEEQITELFHELRVEDERLAPPFARVWNTAVARQETSRHRRRVFRFAAVALTLTVLAGSGVIFLREASRRPAPTRSSASGVSITRWQSPTVTLLESPAKAVPMVDWPLRQAGGSPQLIMLVSQWRSPTDVLLASPDGELLKHVPHLGRPGGGAEAKRPSKKD